MERVAIEAVRVSRALTGDDLQRGGKAGYEGEVPGTLDNNAFRLRQNPRQAFGMVPHARQVIVLRSIDTHGNGDLRQGVVGKARRVRGHEHERPYPPIAEIGDVADLARDFPSGSTTKGAEPGVVGMLSAMRGDCVGTGFGTGDCQRSVAPVRMTHHPDTFVPDVRPELSVFQDCINHAGHLLGAADPHADTGYVVVLSSWVRGGRDSVALRGQHHREISVEQREAAGPMRDDDQPEISCSRWRLVGHRHLERNPSTKDRRQATERE